MNNPAAAGSLPGYEAARQRAAYYAWPGSGYLRIGGPDRVDFLQRQTTNDIRRLAPERALLTVLTSPAARILDVLLLVSEPDAIGALTLPGRAVPTAGFLKSRIFFMDQVTVEDRSADVRRFDVEGPLAGEVLRQAGLDEPPAAGHVVEGAVNGVGIRAVGVEGLAGTGLRLLAASRQAEMLAAALEASGAEPLSGAGYDVLRVEAGLPGVPELHEDYTPLEAGLHEAISGDKGCYTGQEVIARQITYDKVTRRLAGLRLERPTQGGAAVIDGGHAAGTVTSAAVSPRLGPLALAYLRRPVAEPGRAVTVIAEGGEDEINAVVAALPFA